MDRSIAFKRDRRDTEALAVIRSNRGKALMDEVNVYFSGIICAADERLTASAEQQNRNTARLRMTTIESGVIIVLVALLRLARIGEPTAGTRPWRNNKLPSDELRKAASEGD